MTDLVKIPDEDLELVSSEKQIHAAVAEAEVRFELLQKVTTIALKRTFPQDWVTMGQTPYLTAAGAERLRPLFGITLGGLDVKKYDSKDQAGQARYMFVVSGTARFRTDEFAVVGTASSTDQFFATRRDAEGKPYTLPADQVDEQNILKSAYSDLVRSSVVRILGLRGLTWDQLEALGLDRSKAATVTFRSGGGGRDRRVATRPEPAQQDPATAPAPAPSVQHTTGERPPVPPQSPVEALRLAIEEAAGFPYDSEAGCALLQKVTAFKDYLGTRDWSRVKDTAALVALDRLRKLRETGRLPNGQTILEGSANGR
jgi:hypothetical protein